MNGASLSLGEAAMAELHLSAEEGGEAAGGVSDASRPLPVPACSLTLSITAAYTSGSAVIPC